MGAGAGRQPFGQATLAVGGRLTAQDQMGRTAGRGSGLGIAHRVAGGQHLRQGEVAVIGINGESELDLGTLDVHAPAFLYRARTDQGQWQLDRLQ